MAKAAENEIEIPFDVLQVRCIAGQFVMLYTATACALAAVVIAAGLAGLAAGELTGPPPDAAA